MNKNKTSLSNPEYSASNQLAEEEKSNANLNGPDIIPNRIKDWR